MPSVEGSDSASPTVKPTGDVVTPVTADRLPTVEIVGAVLKVAGPATVAETEAWPRTRFTSVDVRMPLMVMSLRKVAPVTANPVATAPRQMFTSVDVTIPFPLISPSKTRNGTSTLARTSLPALVTFDAVTVTACAGPTAVKVTVMVVPDSVVVPSVAVPAVTAAVPELIGWSNVSTSVMPAATLRHSMPVPPLSGN